MIEEIGSFVNNEGANRSRRFTAEESSSPLRKNKISTPSADKSKADTLNPFLAKNMEWRPSPQPKLKHR